MTTGKTKDKSWTWLSDFTFTFHFHALEKEMATHSSVLAWRIPGMGEPGGLPSIGSHRVGHDWSDLAAAARGRGRRLTENWQENSWVVRNILYLVYGGSGYKWHIVIKISQIIYLKSVKEHKSCVFFIGILSCFTQLVGFGNSLNHPFHNPLLKINIEKSSSSEKNKSLLGIWSNVWEEKKMTMAGSSPC